MPVVYECTHIKYKKKHVALYYSRLEKIMQSPKNGSLEFMMVGIKFSLNIFSTNFKFFKSEQYGHNKHVFHYLTYLYNGGYHATDLYELIEYVQIAGLLLPPTPERRIFFQ